MDLGAEEEIIKNDFRAAFSLGTGRKSPRKSGESHFLNYYFGEGRRERGRGRREE